MKRMKFSLVILGLALVSFQSPAQDRYYVVIGAFRYQSNAARFTATASQNGFSAHYDLQPKRQLYYVYILNTDQKRQAFNLLIKTKVETIYKDAWVFIGKLGTEEVVKEIPPEPVKPPVIETPPPTPPVKIEPVKKDTVETKKPEPPVVKIKKPDGIPFYFKAQSKDGKDLTGMVHLQEGTKATQFQSIKIGEVTYLIPPQNKNGTYLVTAQVPGYKESSLTFLYSGNTFEKGTEGETIVMLTLDKAKRGDYIDFNNVHFIANSSLLKPESKDELDGLVTLMKENVKYKIKIYGHCNGTQTRDATTLGSSSNLFVVDPKLNHRGKLSAKDLSKERAEIIKTYLVQQGVDASRVATKGEGGKIPLYPEGGSLGQYNDRVEIEFTKN
ncbi:MAG: OmpA family protein [Bacteroidetes bacterium]|nr:OmpA family protein [Bacteroidota bacterium]